MQNIKNIIFDLGGIFIDIDYSKTEKAFIDVGVANFNDLYNQQKSSALFEDLETGKITPLQFCNALKNVTQLPLTNEKIFMAWNAMLGHFQKDKLLWLQSLKSQYNLYLFSNTNQIHFDAFNKVLEKDTGYNSLDSFFIKSYYSHQIKLRKPYPASFSFILKEQKLVANETLFFDDTPINVKGAIKAGIHAVLVNPTENIQHHSFFNSSNSI